MPKLKTVFIAGAFVIIVGVAWFDHVRQREQIDTLERYVSQINRRVAAQSQEARNSGAPPVKEAVGNPVNTVAGARKTPAELPNQGVVLRNFRDVGRATPQAAMETLAWAVAQRDLERIKGMIALDDTSRVKLQALLDALPPDKRAHFSGPESIPAMAFALESLLKHTGDRVYRIDDQTEIAPGRVRLDYTSLGPRDVPKTMDFQFSNDGWQVVIPASAIDHLTLLLSDPVKLQLLLTGGNVKMPAWTNRK